MELNLGGPSYKSSVIDINNQRCVNWFPSSPGPEGRGPKPLLPTGGLSLLINLGSSPIRAMKTIGDFTYVVVGNSVYKLTIDEDLISASSTLLGTINNSEGTVSIAANPTQVMFVNGTSTGHIYNTETEVFTAITDADFPGGNQVVFIDGYFVVNSPGTGIFAFSALNDGLSWDATEVATAETSTDLIVGLGVNKGELWVMGSRSIEPWYDAANASGSPFSLRSGLQIQFGCGARDSIVSVNDTLVFMDDRGFIVQSDISPFVRDNNSGYSLNIISDEALTEEILTYSRRDDAIAMSYIYRGRIMYQITFPTAETTYVYDFNTKSWHQRDYYDSISQESQYHLGQFYAQSGALHLMAGVRNGKIYTHSPDYFTDNGTSIRRVRTTSIHYDAQDNEIFGLANLKLRVGIGAHQIEDPSITLRYSHDGGHTWSNQMPRALGQTGEYEKLAVWHALGRSREWVLEFSTSEDMEVTLISATVRIV